MNIAVVTPLMKGPGGWGRYVNDLAAGLRECGIRVTVISPSSASPMAVFSIWRDIRECDVVHAIDIVPLGIHAFIAARIRRRPFILTAQGTYAVAPLYRWKTARLARLIYAHADAVIAISRYTRDRIISICPTAKITVINHGVYNAKFAVEAPRERPESLTILSVGGLKRRKGYHDALEAVSLLRKRIPHVRYTILGPNDSPGYAASLRKRAQQIDLQGSVEFRDRMTDQELLDFYAHAVTFVLPAVNEEYHFEGFGLVFLEAAAAGTPSIGTRGNGIEDAIEDGVTGRLVPQNDPQAIAAAVQEIWEDPVRWKRMSDAARAYAAQRDWSRVIEKYKRLYSDILGR